MSDDHDRLVVAFHGDLVLCVIGGDKFLARRSIGDVITGRYDVFAVGAQHRHDGFPVTRLGRADKGAGSLIGCLEGLLGAGDGCGGAKERRCRQ